MDSGLRRFGEEIDRTLHRFRLHKRHRSSEEDQSTGDKVFDNFEYSAEEDDED